MDMIAIPHPSNFIAEELIARRWDAETLALKMALIGDDYGTNRLMVDFYEIVGPEKTNMRMGPVMSYRLAEVFGVSQQFLLNLERAWLVSKGVDVGPKADAPTKRTEPRP